MNKRPLIGILGGMGTAAGLHFQNIFFEICHQNGLSSDADYPEWVYLNASRTPDRTAALAGKGPSPVPQLVSYLKIMETAGADFVIVICNTAHSFYDDIRSEVELPWIHLPEQTADYIRRAGLREIGILTTSGTLLRGIYRKALSHPKIKCIEPSVDSELQARIMSLIYHPEYGIKSSGLRISEHVQQMLINIVQELNTPAILAGCTELSIALDRVDTGVRVIDPVRIAAQVAFDIWQGKRSI